MSSDTLKIFIDRDLPDGDTITIESDFWEYYLRTVRRMRTGDTIEVAGNDHVATTTVDTTDPLTLSIEETRRSDTPDYQLRLVQAITRKQKFETTIKHGTELGITKFVPLVTDRTVRKPNNPEKQHRRWRKIAMDSARITGQDWVPEISEITAFEDFETPGSHSLYVGEPDGESLNRNLPERTDSTIVVGPEGGLTESERNSLMGEGAISVSLGKKNYRSETASLLLSSLWLEKTGNL